jgi:hypothetical protein
MVNLVFIGWIFEFVIILIALVLLILILVKYVRKRHRLTLYLLSIFLFYTIAIGFSMFSKGLVLFSGIAYVYNSTLPDPGTLASWFVLRIIDFRMSFVFLTVAIYLSYVLKVGVFEKGYKTAYRIIVIAYGIFTITFSLIFYVRGNTLLDSFAFLFVFLYMAMIYVPFLIRAYQSYREAVEKQYKNGFLSLSLMSVFFIMVPLNFFIDRLTILFGGPGFSVFYFLAWIFVILGIMGAYFGYIRPRK